MIKAYTTKEQARTLVEKGLDPMTADMSYAGLKDMETASLNKYEPVKSDSEEEEFINSVLPCWSMARLLALLPDEISIEPNSRRRRLYRFTLDKFEQWQYIACYVRGIYPDEDILVEKDSVDSPFDAIYETLLFVLEHDYQDKEIHEEIAEKE